MPSLSELGFCPFFADQLTPPAAVRPPPAPIPARIAAEHRNAYEVWTEKAAGSAQLSGRLRRDLTDEHLPCVGDWVILNSEPAAHAAAVIERVLERRTSFTRLAAGRGASVQAVAANVDLVFAVCGLDADFNLNRIERYVARVWASGAQPFVVLNKADMCSEASVRASDVARRCPGVPVLVTSALLHEGLAALRRSLRQGETAAFVGSSGVGKSSLMNVLIGEDRLPTGDVRQSDGRGRHVTTHRQLVVLPHGGLVIDTPGMRELQLVDEAGLDAVFEDIAALSSRCRFGDCRHDSEPGCAVKEAVQSGAVPEARLEHFRKLAREAEANERRHDARLQRQNERAFGRLTREGLLARRMKGSLE